MKSFQTHKVNKEHEGLTVEDYLKQVLNISGRRVQKLTRQKGIHLNKKPVFLQRKIKAGDQLGVLVLEDKSYGVIPEQGTVDILYEDANLIILNKPSNLLVHPTGQTIKGTLANYLAYYYQQIGVICTIRALHRLDRETTGCVVFAKDAPTQMAVEQQLKENIMKRTYFALIEGIIEPQEGTINAPVGPHPVKPNHRAVSDQGEPAITHYQTLENYPDASLLKLMLETGRTHQIRVHLASLGHPVIGDRMYGKRSVLINRQALHAGSVSLIHPVTQKEIRVEAPMPEDIEYLIQVIKLSSKHRCHPER